MCSCRAAATALAAVVAAFAALVTVEAGAQSPAGSARTGEPNGGAIPWMVALSALRDGDAYEHTLASAHAGVGANTWLSLSLGRSRAPSDETPVDAGLVSLGLEHDFGPVGLALTAEAWGDANNLESRDAGFDVFFGSDTFRFAISHERRDIEVWFSGAGAGPIAADLRRIGVEADGLGFDFRYRPAPLWQIHGSWMGYDYPRGMRFIPRADRLALLSDSAVTLAYSFVDRYATVGIERALGPRLLNLDLGRDRSTIDQSVLRSLGVSLLLPILPRADLELTLGRSHSSGLGSTGYGGLTLLLYRGG